LVPFYSTNESSNINFYGEVAHLIPGHYSSIGEEGTIYIDDFEGASIGYNFGSPPLTWRLASTPKGAKDANGKELFPESALFNDLKTGYNRAKLAWYTIATGFYFSNSNFPSLSNNVINDIYQRQYRIKDIFPQRSRTGPNDLQTTIDLAFFPTKNAYFAIHAPRVVR
jgi:cell surface protein SprA